MPDRDTRPSARVAFAIALAALAAATPTPAADLPADRARAIDQFVERFVDLAMFDGTVIVDVGGEVVYERSFGYANYELGVRHGPDTRFRIASTSKTLTDAAVAVLVAEGKLSVDDPLSRYLPDFPSAGKIRISQLLDHTSGIPHTNRQPWGDAKTSYTLDEIVAKLAELPLDFEPGSNSSYSNGGYAVASKVLEVVGGGTYAEVMRRTVFEPLGMEDTAHLADARAPIPGMATGYEPGAFPGERRHARFYAVETRPGGGSLYSTPGDLLKFMRAVFRDDFVKPELRRTILGDDEDSFLAAGRSPGFVCNAYFERDEDVIVISNHNSYAVPSDWARAIADLATGRVDGEPWGELRMAEPTVPADDPRLGRFEASYVGRERLIERSPRGAMIVEDEQSESTTAFIPLVDGSFLFPLYFQRCVQDENRVITCRMLSGEERYTSVYTPVVEHLPGPPSM